jgi:threonine dehydratase
MSALSQRPASSDNDELMTDYLKKILTARVYDVAFETPLDLAPTLSQRINNQIYFKREDMQSVFSFKIRGA